RIVPVLQSNSQEMSRISTGRTHDCSVSSGLQFIPFRSGFTSRKPQLILVSGISNMDGDTISRCVGVIDGFTLEGILQGYHPLYGNSVSRILADSPVRSQFENVTGTKGCCRRLFLHSLLASLEDNTIGPLSKSGVIDL